MPEKTKATLSFPGFEYEGSFGDPILNNTRLTPIVQVLFETFKQWNIRPQDVHYKIATSATEPMVSFEIANGRVAVSVSHSNITLKVQMVDWSQAELITQIIEACWKALSDALQVTVKQHLLQITLHAAPEGKSLKDITEQFATPWHLRPGDELECCGIILYTASGLVVLDKSAIDPQAFFVRIVHRFGEHATMPEMAKVLYEDEAWLGDVLGLEFA